LVAPLYESIPPALYGGTERVVANLAEELVHKGHEVALYASGDSQSPARLVPVCQKALRLSDCVDSIAHHVLENEWVIRDASQYDVIHFHNGYLHFPLVRRCSTPSLTTLHGRLDLPDLVGLAGEFTDVPLASISTAQRRPLPHLNWIGTAYNGIGSDVLTFGDEPEDYFVFLGRISPEKRADRAIEIARRVGRKLVIAAKVDAADREYFAREIEPMLDDPLVDFVGEVDELGKNDLLRRAEALLFPIDWPEPFGLVMIEAMACGTPVVAFDSGSVPEVMREGVTGFVVRDMDSAARAAGAVHELDRRACREHFERNFTSQIMAERYVRLYDRLVAEGSDAITRPDDPGECRQ
jgi:glycosyltransferase involved in cell wall biosynthesis